MTVGLVALLGTAAQATGQRDPITVRRPAVWPEAAATDYKQSFTARATKTGAIFLRHGAS